MYTHNEALSRNLDAEEKTIVGAWNLKYGSKQAYKIWKLQGPWHSSK